MPDPSRTIPGTLPAEQRPDFQRAEYRDGAWNRKLTRALVRGTAAVRALGEEALPRWPSERPAFYKIRAKVARVARYYARTVEAVTGLVVGAPPTLAEVTDAQIVADWENIDGRGTHGEVFARRLCAEAIVGGYAAILVEAPPAPSLDGFTLADEQALGLRPYWVLITADQIVNWVVDAPDWPELLTAYRAGLLNAEAVRRLSGQRVVRQVTIHEPTDVRDGAFGNTTRDRYRVLSLDAGGVQYAVWEHRKADGGHGEHFAMVASGPMLGGMRRPLPAIPLALMYGGRRVADFVADPGFLGIAELNLDHYQLTADRRYMLRLTHAPTLTLAGFESDLDADGNDKPIEVGPNSVLRSRDPQAKASYTTAPSGSLAASKEERDEIVRQIAALGLSAMGRDRQGGTETAKGRALDLAAENASHAVIAREVQDCVEQAMMFHALHRNAPAPEFEMHTAYALPDVDAQLAGVLWQAVLAGKIDVETWLAFLRTGQIPEGFDAEAYAVEALAAADADRAAIDAAARETQLPDDQGAA